MTAKLTAPRHGTWAEYVKRGCRCDLCREAARLYNTQRKVRNPDLVTRRNDYSRRYAAANPEKRRAVEQQWRDRNPARAREGNARRIARFRLKQYALTQEQHDTLLRAQDGKCAICRAPDTRQLSVDHEHGSGWVRGLLCRRCNLGLGCFGDDPTIISRAIDYLREKSIR